MKLNEINQDDNILVCYKGNYDGTVIPVSDFLVDIDYYKKHEKLQAYTTEVYLVVINAESVIDSVMENEYDNMYEDWHEIIMHDVTTEDIKDIQAVFDRIHSRNPAHNKSYRQDKLIEIDI